MGWYHQQKAVFIFFFKLLVIYYSSGSAIRGFVSVLSTQQSDEISPKACFNSLQPACNALQPAATKQCYQTKQAEVKTPHHLGAMYFSWGLNISQ